MENFFKEYLIENLSKIKTIKNKIKYLNKVILDSWGGISFEFQSNAMGLREEAEKLLKIISRK